MTISPAVIASDSEAISFEIATPAFGGLAMTISPAVIASDSEAISFEIASPPLQGTHNN